ncbi:methyl-accepting chemotaxis protein [Paenibacillus sp. YYML68]|uniref:methyl-accepting chemotaxis protein n=1 Tax=Paenibacillus sp. YYML68 TaxID=2909250 RepID=UPI002493A6A1|nr:methyl-accepting chemotaxis protein [Paenibacillus sp. YYML68]
MFTRLLSKLKLPHLSLKLKLILSFVALLAIFAAASSYNKNQINEIHSQVLHQNAEMNKQQLAMQLKVNTNEIDSIKSAFIISQDEKFITLFTGKKTQFMQLVEQVAATAANADQRKWSARLTNTSTEYTATFDTIIEVSQNNSLTTEEKYDQMARIHDMSQVHKEYIFELVDQFNTAYVQDVHAAIASSNAILSESQSASLITIITVIVVSSVIAFMLIQSFAASITKLQKAVRQIAKGDLTSKINNSSKDELGQLSRDFDQMIEEVRSMLASSQQIAQSLTKHSIVFKEFSSSTAASNKEIVRAIQEISTGAEQQALFSETSSFTISELSDQVRDIAQFIDTVQRRSREAAFNTHTGSKSMEGLQAAATQSEATLHQVYNALDSLTQSSVQIGKIVNSISDISTQTNVLALNAAIEAARAGEHGKGFSVIAEEVRQLSTQTNESSKIISGIVKSLTTQIHGLAVSLSEVKDSFEQQNGKMNESLQSFTDIRTSMDELSDYINQIHKRIEATEHKNNQLIETVHQVAAIAQETAAGVEQVNSSSLQQDAAIHQVAKEADDILELAEWLSSEINRFRITTEEEAIIIADPAQDEPEAAAQTTANDDVQSPSKPVGDVIELKEEIRQEDMQEEKHIEKEVTNEEEKVEEKEKKLVSV